MTTPCCLPVIDLSLLDRGGSNDDDPELFEAKVLQEWNEAFSQFGFCYLSSSSHGLSPLFQRVEAAALQFFTTLTPQEKAAYYLGKGYGHGGYVSPGVERVAASRLVVGYEDGSKSSSPPPPPDPVESLCVHSAKAEHVPPFLPQDFHLQDGTETVDMVVSSMEYKYGLEFKTAVQELWHGLEALLMRIMTMSAKALQLPDSYFHSAYSPGANFMRMAHYVGDADNSDDTIQDQQAGRLRYGVHTDYSGFTLLWRNHSNGLQCAAEMRQIIEDTNCHITTTTTTASEPQSWIDVPVLDDDPHALVVNAGDLIQRWTNDYWVSNLHRVVNGAAPIDDDDDDDDDDAASAKKKKDPLSIVFFTGPALDTKINILPSPVLANQEAKYQEVTAGEHLMQKLAPTST
jgi:isopenicillin N synthase-like dioxygenase